MNRYRDTYKSPRTMLQAFPGHYPESMQRYRRPLAARVWDVLFTVLIAASSGFGLFFYFSETLK